MDFINSLIDTHNIPILTAFLVGILTSISPCPLATNITAIAYISKDVKNTRRTLINGLVYTLGRGLSYTILAVLMYFGLSSFQISSIFQGWGDKVLGPTLIIIGFVMFGVIKINFNTNKESIEKVKEWLATKGYTGTLLLGMLFALAFCPYSGVLFFGVLTPLILRSTEWLLLPAIFALGTGLPVVIFSFLIAFSLKKMGIIFEITTKIEKVSRVVIASIFTIVGIYYLQYLVKFLVSILV